MSRLKRLVSNLFNEYSLCLMILISVLFATCSNPSSSKDNSDNVTPTQAFPPVLPEEVGINQSDLDAIWNVIENWFEAGEMPGAELLIIKDRQTVFHNSIGWKDEYEETPFENGTICQIMSMTKPITGTAVLQLVEDGLLNLDDRASDYIDAFRSTDKHNITIRQLLQHTAGFANPGITGSITQFQSIDELINTIAITPLNSLPGTEFLYSMASASTLTYIINYLTGVRTDIYINQNIISLLGMDHSFCQYDVTDYRNDIISTFYQCDPYPVGNYIETWEPGEQTGINIFYGSSGAFSSTVDYAKFLAAWADAVLGVDETLISQELALLALEPSPQSLAVNFPYGFLFFTSDPNNTNSITYMGHTGVGGTAAGAFPDEDIIFVYFSQCVGTQTRFQVTNLIIDNLNL